MNARENTSCISILEHRIELSDVNKLSSIKCGVLCFLSSELTLNISD